MIKTLLASILCLASAKDLKTFPEATELRSSYSGSSYSYSPSSYSYSYSYSPSSYSYSYSSGYNNNSGGSAVGLICCFPCILILVCVAICCGKKNQQQQDGFQQQTVVVTETHNNMPPPQFPPQQFNGMPPAFPPGHMPAPVLCLNGHPMQQLFGFPNPGQTGSICDKCNQNIFPQNGFNHCQGCDSDLCMNCSQEVQRMQMQM